MIITEHKKNIVFVEATNIWGIFVQYMSENAVRLRSRNTIHIAIEISNKTLSAM